MRDCWKSAIKGRARDKRVFYFQRKHMCREPVVFGTSHFNTFSATRRYKRHQNKVKVKGLGRKSSYLDGFSDFFHGSMKKFNHFAKKKLLKMFLALKLK